MTKKIRTLCKLPACPNTIEAYASARRRFCSRACQNRYYNPILKGGKKGHPAPWLAKYNKEHNATLSRRTAVQRSATLRAKNRAKRGGKDRKGYLSTHVEGKGSRHTHRIVAERILGRKLRRGEIFHHVDGDIQNNNPNNLQVLSRADHLRVHCHLYMFKRKEVIRRASS